jgi:ring-1,2-phenylacetyl-CoA epoxidase subunit PaaC
MLLVWRQLQHHADTQLAAIAAKSIKEVDYHFQHALDWLVRFGDGTDESHLKAQMALHFLMPYTQEFWNSWPGSELVLGDLHHLHADWTAMVTDAVSQAGLQFPSAEGYVTQGHLGVHSEHMSYLLAEMQSLARQFPGAAW